MRYLVAASAPDLAAKVSKRFGHAKCYLAVDPATFDFEVFRGAGEQEPFHGVGRFRDIDISAVIVGNIGPEAFRDVSDAGWPVYSCLGSIVKEAIVRVRDGTVSPLRAPTMKRSVRTGQRGHER